MTSLGNWLKCLLRHNKTAILAVAGAAAGAAGSSLSQGRINWPAVGGAALTAVAAAAQSPIAGLLAPTATATSVTGTTPTSPA